MNKGRRTEEMAVQFWGFKMMLRNPSWKTIMVLVLLLVLLFLPLLAIPIISLLKGTGFRPDVINWLMEWVNNSS